VIPRILGRGGGGGGAIGGGGGHLLVLSATGSGKTAAFALPLLQELSSDPYGIFGLVLTPTRELAKQITQQILALGRGSGMRVTCALVVGGEDATRQGLELGKKPNFVVATPGRLAELCRAGGGDHGPDLSRVRFVVMDEADRLLSARSGFERDVAEILLQSTTTTTDDGGGGGGGKRPRRRDGCRTLLFSATMTRSLASLEGMAGGGAGRLPLEKVVVREDGSWDDGGGGTKKKKKEAKTRGSDGDDDVDKEEGDSDDDDDDDDGGGSTPNIPAGLRQEYVFMPERVREAYLLCVVRTLMTNGGRGSKKGGGGDESSGWNDASAAGMPGGGDGDDEEEDDGDRDGRKPRRRHPLARSAIIFAPTCERCAHISGILTELGVRNVSLHSLLSQNRRLASLGTFQSQRVRVLVATDVASRGLDVPEVDLVINAELPRRAVDYVHRVGRTARAGRRGRAVSLVGEGDVDLVHEAERISGRPLERCAEVTDDMAVRLLGPVAKASRLTRMKLMDIGFDELVAKHGERKRRDRRRREKAEGRAKKAAALAGERGGKR
jgi:ATP-dependent RNA helicase DDX49/DBP8